MTPNYYHTTQACSSIQDEVVSPMGMSNNNWNIGSRKTSGQSPRRRPAQSTNGFSTKIQQVKMIYASNQGSEQSINPKKFRKI
jgi:hypothetical protein